MLEFAPPSPAVGWTIVALWLGLVAASVAVRLVGRRTDMATRIELEERTNTWWWIVALLSLVILAGKLATIVFIALISYLALKEYLTALPIRRADRRVLLLAYLAVPIQYIFVGYADYGMFAIFIPVYAFIFLTFGLVLAGETAGFIRSVGVLHWGLMLTVYNLSHLAFLLVLPMRDGVSADGFALLLFVLIIVQANDVAQYVWGKLFGKHKIVPKVSPGKTWEGFLFGGATIVVLSLILAPFLTPFGWAHAAIIGAILAASGFVGDVALSAVKRDLGLKDMGNILPGHGGYLDRLDSLTLSAPLFFHFSRYFYGA